MALGISGGSGSGEVRPFLKYDARAGRMFRVDRSQGATGEWKTDNVDITNQAAFVADLANIEVGWLSFTDKGPVRVLTSIGKPIPPRPEGTDANGKPAFKQGFNLRVALPKDLGGGVREFSSSAGCVIEAVDELHNAYVASPESVAGKLPVVALVSTLAVKSGQSTNYKPVFEIKGWQLRPESFGVVAAAAQPAQQPATASVQRSSPPATGSTVMPPPPAAQPAMAAASREFG